jgi:hypothetical protein
MLAFLPRLREGVSLLRNPRKTAADASESRTTASKPACALDAPRKEQRVPFLASGRASASFALLAFGIVLLFAMGTNFYPYFYPHYVAAITCLLLLFAVRGLQSLSQGARLYVVLACCVSFAFWFLIYFSGNDALLFATRYQTWNYIDSGDPQGRVGIEQQLASTQNKQIVFVRYSPAHRFEEWIHNDADIDGAKTIWANDLGAAENVELLRRYPDRKAWLLQPDLYPLKLEPYPSDSDLFQTVH